MQYMGSKNRLAKELVPIIESYITENTRGYLEPFVGGANVIDKINFDKKYGCDINEELIELLKYVQNLNNKLPTTISEEEYKKVKNNKEDYEKWYVGLVGFCGSFGAKYFGGYARSFKADGTSIDKTAEGIRNIEKQRKNLKNIKFKHCSFTQINKNISGYVIYCDPPYRNATKYKSKSFPYEEFYNWCREMSKNNTVLISEYNMPDDFECIWQKEAKVYFDSNRKQKEEKNKRIEKLFIYKGDE